MRWIGTLDDATEAVGPVVWLVRWDDPRVDGWTARVPPDPADLARFAGRADAGRRIVRRRLARLLIATAHGDGPVMLDDAQYGSVIVASPAGWHLSLAGADAWCAIAIAREPLGIDIEALAGEPLPPDLLTAGERAWLATLPVADRLPASLACWTGKEAHAKRLGRPRRNDPATIEVLGGAARSAGDRSRLAMRSGDGWVAAVALRSAPPS